MSKRKDMDAEGRAQLAADREQTEKDLAAGRAAYMICVPKDETGHHHGPSVIDAIAMIQEIGEILLRIVTSQRPGTMRVLITFTEPLDEPLPDGETLARAGKA